MAKDLMQPKYRRVPQHLRRAQMVEAGLACLAKVGILGFTVENICREAGVSNGLLAHHFGSKENLLAAVYARIYEQLLGKLAPVDGKPLAMGALIDAIFSSDSLRPENLNLWLALWGQIGANPVLQAEHRKYYALYRDSLARAISEEARQRGVTVDSYALAMTLISLIDGLWLEQAIDPAQLSVQRAKALCHSMVEAAFGPARQLSRP